jgi:cytidylate kinase
MSIVTISRGTFSGGEALAQCLTKKTGLPAVGVEVIKEAATLYGISESEISQQLKQGPKVWERLLGEKRRLYFIALQSAMAERAAKGDFIYYGLAGHFLLHGVPNVFKVRLVAPLSYRIKNEMAKKNITGEVAKEYIEKVDERRKQWTKFFYHVDWTDPSLYDMVINLENLSIDTACGVLMYALSQPEFQSSPEKKKAVEDFALSCQINAKIAFNERTKGIELGVEVKDGNVRIQGKLYTTVGMFATGLRQSEAEIITIVKSVPGVKDVKVDLQELPVAVE